VAQGGGIGLSVAVAIALAVAAPAPSAAADAVAGGGCREVNAFVERVPAEAARVFLPEGGRYRLVEPNATLGLAEVFVDMLACERFTVGARTRPATYATVSITIEPPPGSTGDVNFYLVSWVTDNPDLSAWLKDRTGLEERVRLVRDLVMRWDSLAGFAPSFGFSAPFPSPTPFTASAVVRDPLAPVEVRGNYWRETSAGTVRIETSHPAADNRFGLSAGRVEVPAGSETERLLGGETVRDFEGVASDFSRARWQKDVVPPAGTAEP
jgi:hypothetical protein